MSHLKRCFLCLDTCWV